MANLKSSKKDIRRIAKRTAHNRQVKSTLKTLRKAFEKAKTSGDVARTKAASTALISAMDKAAKRQIIHPNKANRHKIQCAKYLMVNGDLSLR